MSEPKHQYMREVFINGMRGEKPLSSSYEVLRSLAKEKLPKGAFDYVDGSAGTEKTYKANADAFQKWQIVPTMLGGTDASDFNSEVQLFGRTFPTPLIVAPIGVQGQLHKDADVATATAAKDLNIPFTFSSASSFPLETVSKEVEFNEEAEPGQEAWFQLYWPLDDDVTISILKRAKESGYKVLVVTLDTYILGWRPRDIDAAYNPFLKGQGVANVFADPVFVEKYCDGQSPLREGATEDDITSASIAAIGQLNPGISRSWSELAFLRKHWGDLPIVLKGIQSVSDAARAVEAGMDGVWISNHGGRQIDGAIGSLQALRPIAQYLRAHAKHVSIIFDSGVRSGSDIIKALALGAHAVAIGRPWAWGLTLNGEEGVSSVLKGLLADLEITATLAGAKSVSAIGPHMLVKAGEEPRL